MLEFNQKEEVEVLHRDSELLNSVTTRPATSRVERAREFYLGTKLSASINKLRIETRVMKGTEGEPMEVRRAKVFSAFVRETPISILPDELIVGLAGDVPKCHLFDPEELEGIDGWLVRKKGKGFTDEEQRELKEEIIPYWKGEGQWEKTRQGRVRQAIPPIDRVGAHDGVLNIGHNCLAYGKVLEKGFLGVKKDAEERLTRIDSTDPDDVKKAPFLQGVIIAMEAAAEIGKRFAERARALAESEKNENRKQELLEIAEVCDWVPANPARTFHEALQAIYFARMLVSWETPYSVSQSVGRVEQLLNPYYENDIKNDTITRDEIQEFIDCFLIKLNHSGSSGNHIGVGGVTPNGQDATNDLSYMFLEGMEHTRLAEPYNSILLHGKTPDELLLKACQLLSLGTGHPVFINNDVQVEQMLARPIPLQQARSVVQVGCYEGIIPGLDAGYQSLGVLNIGEMLELALANGWSRFYKKQLGPETGDPRQFKSIEELKDAFRKQVAWRFKEMVAIGEVRSDALAELCPTPYESALIDDCIERGISREAGGARFNFSQVAVGTGAIDAGDSLTVIKKLVFEENKITMDQLCDALEKNFEGVEDLRRIVLQAPKFGNDNDIADEQTAWVSHMFAEEVTSYRNRFGDTATPIGAPMERYVTAGKVTGALPSGRLAGEPLSDAWSPSIGADKNGPTAIFKSVGKIDHVELLSGVTLNMRLDPEILKDESGMRRTMDLIRTLVDQKIFMVQFNLISSETLRAAQKTPDNYRDVIVKVAGYSAYFVSLPKILQDNIIARTEHRF